jgi:hypothetical protein
MQGHKSGHFAVMSQPYLSIKAVRARITRLFWQKKKAA